MRWQVVKSLWLSPELTLKEQQKHVRAAMAMLAGIEPADEMEGMLATQMVATHSAAMECFRRAMLPSESVEDRAKNLRDVARLTSVYLRQMEVLNKHRGKGQQKVTVEHVNVHSGAQAIVGNVETGGRGKSAEGNGAVEPAPIENPPQIKDSSGGKKPGRRRTS